MLDQWIKIIEGLLFMVGDEGLSIEQLKQVCELEDEHVLFCLDQISDSCKSEIRGIELVNFGGQYKFVTKTEIFDYASKLYALPEKSKMSQAALETLAIIAYKQPITRLEIEEIRGVNCDAMIHKLVAKALIREAGRSDAPGKPILYEVTDEFMDTFKLESIHELPDLPELNSTEELELFAYGNKNEEVEE